ncbi:MAG: acyl-CoA synthetase, partial [Acidimicrobiia bacterium]
APQASFYDSLGASEAVGFGLSLTSHRGEASTARFRLGVNARVLDADDHDVVPGAAGILAVTDSTGVSYYNDPVRSAATFRVIDGRRYAVLGDWAVPHADGTITLLGRGSGCINTGGEKVWPEEVEASLKTHPAVLDAVVVGVPDAEWGEAVAAVVATRQRSTDADRDAPTAHELAEWVATQLARYKRPRRVELVDEVQRTTVGKPDYEWARSLLTTPPITS